MVIVGIGTTAFAVRPLESERSTVTRLAVGSSTWAANRPLGPTSTAAPSILTDGSDRNGVDGRVPFDGIVEGMLERIRLG